MDHFTLPTNDVLEMLTLFISLGCSRSLLSSLHTLGFIKYENISFIRKSF